MIVRLLAALWLVTTVWSLSLGFRALLGASKIDVAARLTTFTDGAARVGKWQLRPALLLAAAVIQSFFANNLNSALWPWCTISWIALFSQLLFVRPHMGGYIEIVQRGFKRPVEQFLVAHVGLDLIVLGPLIALLVSGVQ